MNLKIVALAAALALAGAGASIPARAQSQPSPETMQSARDLAALITKDTIDEMASRVTAQVWPRIENALKAKQSVTPAQVDDLRREFQRIQVEFITKVMADAPVIYARHFTAEELRQLLAFYHTPLGQKSLRTMPQIATETMALIMPHLAELQTEAVQAFVKVLHKRGFDI